MQFPILIGLRRSRFLDVAVLVATLLASVSILAFSGTALIQSGLLFTTWVFALLAWRNLKPCFQTIRLERSGYIFAARVEEAGFSSVKLEPFSTVHPWLAVIRLKTDDGRCSTVIVTVDSVVNVDFRHLRVFLRWQAKISAPDDDV